MSSPDQPSKTPEDSQPEKITPEAAVAPKPSSPQPASAVEGEPAKTDASAKEGMRETMEAIVFAFFLAFLFRTFEAEAFVIPTGSMAPTLYGRHKEMDCEQCGSTITFGASQELDAGGYLVEQHRIQIAYCNNCRFENNSARDSAVYGGDRILVNKFSYDYKDPKRFDVVVFKYPEDPKINYIKRLVGLPNETLVITRGDLFVEDENGGLKVQRKSDPTKQKQIQIMVYDDRYPEKALIEKGWPRRWESVTKADTALQDRNRVAGWSRTNEKEGWIVDEEQRTYRMGGERAGKNKMNWLRYRHFIPSNVDWEHLAEGRALRPKPKLISDFCEYNATGYFRAEGLMYREPEDGAMWVSDLSIGGEVEFYEAAETPEFVLELTEGVYSYRCRIDLKTGTAKLVSIDAQQDPNEEREMATAQTAMRSTGTYRFTFANVDDRLCLWIDNQQIDFGKGNLYERLPTDNLSPQESDFTPAGLAVQGTGARIGKLVLKRDIYYRGETLDSNQTDFSALRMMLDNPSSWKARYDDVRDSIDYAAFKIPEGEFLVLGDNSPRSKDSRLWDVTHTVPRQALVGKAFFIFWPRPIPFGGENSEGYPVLMHKSAATGKKTDYRSFSIPFYPNFSRMRRIR